MRVLKFGGTSVGSATGLLQAKSVIESCTDDIIVVVSALGGITDQLIKTSRTAAAGDPAYEEQLAAIAQAATRIPIFCSANMSLGVNVLLELVRNAARALGDRYDIEIVERHHNKKVDAPSGTALMIADAAAEVLPYQPEYVYDRQAVRQPRGKTEFGISSVRGGGIVGDHEVIFAGRDEVIELRHSAMSREVFASGAVRAAQFLASVGQPGLYSMSDLLHTVL